MANGVDRNRLALVLAVLTRHAGIALGSADVFVSVAGGVRVDEPGADLAVALAVASAARGTVLGDGRAPLAAFGELGPHRRAAARGPPGPAAGGGEEVRADLGAASRRRRLPDLRTALRRGLGQAEAAPARAA